jgi:fucose permease
MLCTQIILVPVLLQVMRERALIVASFLGVLLKMVGLTLAQTKAHVFQAILSGTLYGMAYPSICSIKANAVPMHEQGAVQGALGGATALASGIGPLVLNHVYRLATTTMFMPRVRSFCC